MPVVRVGPRFESGPRTHKIGEGSTTKKFICLILVLFSLVCSVGAIDEYEIDPGASVFVCPDVWVGDTGAVLVEKWNLTPTSANGQANSAYFTFKEIPVEAGETYYSKFGTRSWYLDINKQPVKTLNLSSKSGTGSDVQYEFVVPDGVSYISIAYSYASAGSPSDVYIRNVSSGNCSPPVTIVSLISSLGVVVSRSLDWIIELAALVVREYLLLAFVSLPFVYIGYRVIKFIIWL